MRITAIGAGLFLCVLVFMTSDAKVHAEAIQSPVFDTGQTSSSEPLAVLELVEQKSVEQQQKDNTAEVVVPPVKTHQVSSGESLTKIAEAHQTTWQRVYAKNTQIADPNIITAGAVITIPSDEETLAERPLPVAVVAPAPTRRTTSTTEVRPASAAPRGSVAGNSYTYGYCTWYVKNRRPDMPNNLGNANTWVSRASAQGMATGSTPRAGAVGQSGMHVVYVERVNADGTVFVSEMNREGWNVISTRTVPANYFQYVY